MREIRQSGSEGGGAPWRSLPLLVLSRLRRFRMTSGPETLLVSSEGVRRRRVGNCYETSPYSSDFNAA